VLLIGSFVLLVVVCVVNLGVSGFVLVASGVVLNLAVIGLNAGMPVSRHALAASGQLDTVHELVDRQGYVKHHLAGPDDRLLALGDVIAIPPPIGQAVSVGDVLTSTGIAWVIVAGMRRRRSDEAPSAGSLEAMTAPPEVDRVPV
jgi:hypothetical protein